MQTVQGGQPNQTAAKKIVRTCVVTAKRAAKFVVSIFLFLFFFLGRVRGGGG